jgi:hypothetical protein
LFLLLAIVTARLVWIASRTEIGWELLGCQWQDATLGRFGLRPTSIDALPPAEQAAYWLPQVERIMDESPPSAQLAMGAAWVLDSPDQRWQGYSVPSANSWQLGSDLVFGFQCATLRRQGSVNRIWRTFHAPKTESSVSRCHLPYCDPWRWPTRAVSR